MKFCTEHSSNTAMLCAKFQDGQTTRINITDEKFFFKIWFWDGCRTHLFCYNFLSGEPSGVVQWMPVAEDMNLSKTVSQSPCTTPTAGICSYITTRLGLCSSQYLSRPLTSVVNALCSKIKSCVTYTLPRFLSQYGCQSQPILCYLWTWWLVMLLKKNAKLVIPSDAENGIFWGI